jgi:hypothetical protein
LKQLNIVQSETEVFLKLTNISFLREFSDCVCLQTQVNSPAVSCGRKFGQYLWIEAKIVHIFRGGIWKRGEPAPVNRLHWLCCSADRGGLGVKSEKGNIRERENSSDQGVDSRIILK